MSDILIGLTIIIFIKYASAELRNNEYCHHETFNATCSGSQIIKISSAKLGRMKIGQCIHDSELKMFHLYRNDLKYFGCFKDVYALLSRECNNKNSCHMKVIELENKNNDVCGLGLKMYLEASYSCIEVISFQSDCKVIATTDRKSFIPNLSSITHNCGSVNKPFKIIASKGRKIKLIHSLIFENVIAIKSNSEKHICKYLGGIVVDQHGNKNISICAQGFVSSNDAISTIYSSSNQLQLIFYWGNNEVLTFNLEIEADGCSDLIPPGDSWLKRNNNDIVIGCYSSQNTWYLRCMNKQWTGAVGNCSSPIIYEQKDHEDDIPRIKTNKIVMSQNKQILIIVTISAFGFVICLIIVFFGVICLKRMKIQNSTKLYSNYYNQGQLLNPLLSHLISSQKNVSTIKDSALSKQLKHNLKEDLNENPIVENEHCFKSDDLNLLNQYYILDKEQSI